jgi:hypothetical protein
VASVALTVPASDIARFSDPEVRDPGTARGRRGVAPEVEKLGLQYAGQVMECAQELTKRLGAARSAG